MYGKKSLLRLKYIKKRRQLYLKNNSFSFNKIFFLIKKNFPKKKPLIAGYYPSSFEVNVLDFLYQANKNKFKIVLPVIKNNFKMSFKHWVPQDPLYVNKYGILEPKKKNIVYNPDIF